MSFHIDRYEYFFIERSLFSSDDNRSLIDGATLCDHAMRENYVVIRVAHRCEMNAATHKLGLRGFHVEKRKKETTTTGEACNNKKKKKKVWWERWTNLKICPDNDAEFYVFAFSKIMDRWRYGDGCNTACNGAWNIYEQEVIMENEKYIPHKGFKASSMKQILNI